MAAGHRIYARALFDAAKEQGRVAEVQSALQDFRTTVDEVPELRRMLENPQLDPGAKRAALAELLGDSEELVRNFLLLIAEKGRAGELDQFVDEFDTLVARDEGRLNVELTTAYELSEDDAASILKKIEQIRYNVWRTRPELSKWEKAALLAPLLWRKLRAAL